MDIKYILLEIELHYGIFSGFKETYLIPRDQQTFFFKSASAIFSSPCHEIQMISSHIVYLLNVF